MPPPRQARRPMVECASRPARQGPVKKPPAAPREGGSAAHARYRSAAALCRVLALLPARTCRSALPGAALRRQHGGPALPSGPDLYRILVGGWPARSSRATALPGSGISSSRRTAPPPSATRSGRWPATGGCTGCGWQGGFARNSAGPACPSDRTCQHLTAPVTVRPHPIAKASSANATPSQLNYDSPSGAGYAGRAGRICPSPPRRAAIAAPRMRARVSHRG